MFWILKSIKKYINETRRPKKESGIAVKKENIENEIIRTRGVSTWLGAHIHIFLELEFDLKVTNAFIFLSFFMQTATKKCHSLRI